MREGFRVDVTPARALKAVVTDGRSCLNAGAHILIIGDLALFGGVTPNTCKAVGLEFQTDRKRIHLTWVLLLQTAHFGFNPHQFLNVMTNLMRNDVCLGKLAGSAEAGLQFLKKAKVEIDLFIFGAIKGADRSLSCTAAGWKRVAVQHETRMPVPGIALFRKDTVPGVLHVVKHKRHEFNFHAFGVASDGIGAAACNGRCGRGTT
ncbi:MAG: hypothetical protein QOJ99_5785 [Bryobacterales bacterium]|nr:hypothetical protein [Bryobacterales bacterium]